jgi:hypothetical protein
VPYKQVKEKKAPSGPPTILNGEGVAEAGQTTVAGKIQHVNGTNGFSHERVPDEVDAGDPNAQIEMEIRGARTSHEPAAQSNQQPPQDVEMN